MQNCEVGVSGRPVIGDPATGRACRDTLARWLGMLVVCLSMFAASVADAQTSTPPLRIGFSIARSGVAAGNGTAGLLAMKMWAEDVNQKGGILGRKVDLVYYDDQSNATLVPGIYSKLLDVDKVDLVVSPYGTNFVAPAMPIVMSRGMVFLSSFALGVNEEFKYGRYFQMQPNGSEGALEYSRGFFEIAAKLNPKPTTVALVGDDAEFGVRALEGARENAKRYGVKIVYDKRYPPSTTDFTPILRSIRATNPDLVYIASYPLGSVGLLRSASELAFKPKLLGGATMGLQFASIKTQLGELLNGILCYDLYVPEPTMKFEGIDRFLARYQERAVREGTDALGFYLPSFQYALMQILGDAVQAVGAVDQAKIAEHVHKTTFKTIVGDVAFGADGEWKAPRTLVVQYQGIKGNDVEQFKQPGRQIIVWPPQYKSGELKTFDEMRQ